MVIFYLFWPAEICANAFHSVFFVRMFTVDFYKCIKVNEICPSKFTLANYERLENREGPFLKVHRTSSL